MARGAPLALLALALVLAVLAPCAGAGVMTGNDLEELAWRFRFAHGEAHASVLLEPLQRTLKAMQEHVAAIRLVAKGRRSRYNRFEQSGLRQ